MKRVAQIIFALLTVFLFLLIQPVSVTAQDFNRALQLYEEEEYLEAIEEFKKIDSPESRLFIGKSYFGLGQLLLTKAYLQEIAESNSGAISLDAKYTIALSDVRLKQFGNALNSLHEISDRMPRTQLVNDARQLYNDILDYLTLTQRKDAFQQARYHQIKVDLIKSAFGKVDYTTARILLEELKESSRLDSTSSELQTLESVLSDSLSYAYQVAFGDPVRAPEGLVYNLGVALPQFDNQSPEYNIVQGLYFGYLLAAEEFNQQHTDRKVFIKYKNTGSGSNAAEVAMTDFVWNYGIDAVLGPLYSEAATRMAYWAEQYKIPMIAPLANSDSLNIDNPYLFQANPTFGSHGRKMADFASENLGMDTVAVLAERNSLGEASAYAFRRQFEQMGGHVAYFFVENLESQGYEITEYTKFFTADSVARDTLGYPKIDAIYAPFTGQVAPTLMELLLIDLEAAGSEIPVLGSQEWGANQIPEERLENRTVYFSESYYINRESERVKRFEDTYKERFGTEPTRFAMIGYDTASYLLKILDRVINPSFLKEAIKEQPLYEGIIGNIHFEGRHINQEVKIFKMTNQGINPATY